MDGTEVVVKVPNDRGLYDLRVQPTACRYYNEESNYGVYVCFDLDTAKVEKGAFGDEWTKYESIHIVGSMQRLIPGKSYEALAEKIHHPTYGEQYKIHMIYSNEANTKEDERSMLLELVEFNIYQQIVDLYEYPITTLLSGDLDYSKIKGMGKVRYDSLFQRASQCEKYIKAQSELGKYGITFGLIMKIVDVYGSPELAIQKVKKNPYILYHDIKGIGFLKADIIAKAVGLTHDCPQRITACIVHALELEEFKGNTWGILMNVKSKTEELLGFYFEVNDFLEYCLNDKIFYCDGERVAMKLVYNCEKEIAVQLKRIHHGTGNFLFDESDIDQKLALMEKQLKVTYEAKQRRLFFEGNRSKIVVLTGFAGTGKSFLINGYLKIMESKFNSIMLVSPTAKAAKVLSKATGRTATTIHRALKWMFGKFIHNLHNKLRCDLIVVDEASMIDIYLFRSLLQALPDNCRMVIIGDTAQLESVAVGNVLHDIINSQCFPVVSLTEVYRQALDSGSLLAATLVRQGRKFYDENMLNCEMGLERDFKAWFGTKEQSCDRVKSLYASAVKIWDTEDILVITPMKIGNAGVVNLNKELQNIANPLQRQKQLVVNKNTFRENDKVRHTKNDYQAPWLDKDYNQVESQEKGVFNGDFGKIKEIVGNLIYVDYGDKIIRYIPPYQSLDLAYAITVHSSQGSQSPVVIGVLDVSHYLNLKRNLLYTMMTRAENNLYLIAQKKALGMAISNNTIPQKQTFLEEHLKK